jgi:hypothetical protein
MNNKISKLSAYIVLLCYLTITITYIFHHHNIDLGKSSSILNPSDKNQNIHFYLNGSVDFCPVQTAYNSLQNSLAPFFNPFQNYEKHFDFIINQTENTKPLKAGISHYSLRAPPKAS